MAVLHKHCNDGQSNCLSIPALVFTILVLVFIAACLAAGLFWRYKKLRRPRSDSESRIGNEVRFDPGHIQLKILEPRPVESSMQKPMPAANPFTARRSYPLDRDWEVESAQESGVSAPNKAVENVGPDFQAHFEKQEINIINEEEEERTPRAEDFPLPPSSKRRDDEDLSEFVKEDDDEPRQSMESDLSGGIPEHWGRVVAPIPH